MKHRLETVYFVYMKNLGCFGLSYQHQTSVIMWGSEVVLLSGFGSIFRRRGCVLQN